MKACSPGQVLHLSRGEIQLLLEQSFQGVGCQGKGHDALHALLVPLG